MERDLITKFALVDPKNTFELEKLLLEARELNEKYKRSFSIDYEMVELEGYYVIDRSDTEDVKWEGLKELKVGDEIGREIIRKGLFCKNVSKVDLNTERHTYKVMMLKYKELELKCECGENELMFNGFDKPMCIYCKK